MTTILVDMDGTIADWGRRWDLALARYGEPAKHIPRHADQRTFDLHAGRTPDESDIIANVMDEPGFYADLLPIPGAIAALERMVKAGHHVLLVTSPWPTNATCASDKIAWVIRYLGSDWASRVVITHDKTVVHGDVLIDDKPHITGSRTPTWRHVRFDQPYNRDVSGMRLIAWKDWEAVL